MCVVYTWVHVGCVRMSVGGCERVFCQCIFIEIWILRATKNLEACLVLPSLDLTVQITTHLACAQPPTACPFPVIIPRDPRRSPGKMASSHSTDGETETQGPEEDGSASKSQELVFGQMSALTYSCPYLS